MRQINCAMTGVIERHRTHVLYFFSIFVVAIDEAFTVRINDVPVPRIGNDEPAFTTTSLKPILATDYSRVRAARNTDIRIVLLRAVNVVRERDIHGHVIELRGWLVVLSGPIFAAISGNRRAAITHIGDSVWVRWIDPESVMISVPCRHQVEGLSAIDRFKESGV